MAHAAHPAGGQPGSGGSQAPVGGPAQAEQKTVLEQAEINRAWSRIAHEIVERTRGAQQVVLLGIPTRGVPLAGRLAARIAQVEGQQVPHGSLDVTMYRDDLRLRPARTLGRTEVPADGIDGKTVVLVDDVLYSGRTVRAALDALNDLGRPRAVQLAVLVDRGHRELPIRADYVGKNLPTSQAEVVRVLLTETDGEDAVLLEPVGRQRGISGPQGGGHQPGSGGHSAGGHRRGTGDRQGRDSQRGSGGPPDGGHQPGSGGQQANDGQRGSGAQPVGHGQRGSTGQRGGTSQPGSTDPRGSTGQRSGGQRGDGGRDPGRGGVTGRQR